MNANRERLVSEIADLAIEGICRDEAFHALTEAILAHKDLRHEEYFAQLFKSLAPFEVAWQIFLRAIWDEERRIVLANLKHSKRWSGKLSVGQIDSLLYAKSEFIKKLSKEARKTAQALIEQQGKYFMSQLDVDVAFDIENPKLQSWLSKYSIKLSKNLEAVNTDELRSLLKKAIAAGETIPEIMERVNGLFSEWDRNRAEVIARTETSRANNKAATDTYRQSGVVDKVEWLASPGCCEDCDALDGTVIDLGDEFFDADYDTGEGPPRHPNCRCALLPVVD